MSLTEKELEALRESEARSRIVVETLADAVLTIDESSIIRYANPAADRIFGYERGELAGLHMAALMPDYLSHMNEEGVRRYVEPGVELHGLHKTGREIPLEVSFGEFALDGRRCFTCVARDVTERKRTDARLAAQYEVTRALAETANFAEAVPRILRAVCEALGWEVGALWALDRAADVLRFAEAWSVPGVDVREFVELSRERTFARGDGLPGKVWERGEAAWIEDIAGNGNFSRSAAAAREGLHGAFAFPATLRGETIAVLEFFSREVRPPDDALLAMMSHVGSQLGQVIERRRAEGEQARLRERVMRAQEELLAELSTPLIPLTHHIVLMPIIGAVDGTRARLMIDALLRGLERTRAPVAIIDITGVVVVDEHVANTLLQSARAARLLGTDVILTGMRSGVARSIVRLGVDLSGVHTRKTLQEGIALAHEHLRRRSEII